MTERDLINDMKFRHKCCDYGLDWEDFNIIDDTIILNTSKDNILVILDEHYNIINIYDKNKEISKVAPIEKRIKEIKELYENAYVKLPYPFENLSLKQIVELSNRVYIHETNHGHSSNIFVNGELVNDEVGSIYVSLLAYIKFLGQQIEDYFKNLYQMKMMELDYPFVYTYIKSLIDNINKCINENIEKGNRPFPIDIINYLGQDVKKISQYNHELYKIIDLLLKEKDIKINDGFENYKKIEITEKETFDLSDIANKLLKILEVSNEEVELRYQESNKTFETKEINLKSWLSESITNDRYQVLTKSKN